MIGEGVNRVRIVESYLSVAGTGTEMLCIVGEEVSGSDRITAFLYFTERSMKHTVKSLSNLGFDARASGFDFSLLDGDDSPILGAEADFDCAFEEYDGTDRLKVKWINRPGQTGGAARRMSDDERRKFAARMRTTYSGGAAPAAPRPAEPAGSKDDDIPF